MLSSLIKVVFDVSIEPSHPEVFKNLSPEQKQIFAEMKETIRSSIEEQQHIESQRKAQQQVDKWYADAEIAKKKYPSFDFRIEAQNRDFIDLLKKGISVQQAYELIHIDEIKAKADVPQTILFANKKVKAQLEEAELISGIVNNINLSPYNKAVKLYGIWRERNNQTAKSIFEMMRGAPALKEGYYQDIKETKAFFASGGHISFKSWSGDFKSIMREDFEAMECAASGNEKENEQKLGKMKALVLETANHYLDEKYPGTQSREAFARHWTSRETTREGTHYQIDISLEQRKRNRETYDIEQRINQILEE